MGVFTVFLYHRYYLKRIHQVKLKPDLLYGDRYIVDLELGIKHKKGSYRFSEHVYQKKGSSRLCSPKGLTWNKAATVYFVLLVKDQGEWVYHFINEITAASLLTEDENFHVIVVDFESQDISISQAFDTDLLRRRHTIINMKGKFYKTLALNKAVEHIPSEHDLLFLFDLHIDVPADIMDSVRKVRLKIYFNLRHGSKLKIILIFQVLGNSSQRLSSFDNNIKTIQKEISGEKEAQMEKRLSLKLYVLKVISYWC